MIHRNRFLLALLSLVVGSVFAHTGKHSNLGDEASAIQAAGKTYHQSVSVIRKMHPEFLLHKRDKTLRQGVRTEVHSLQGCVSCHANTNPQTAQYYRVDAQGQFCAACHQQVSVSMDCFDCHRATPGQAAKQEVK